MHFIVVLTVLKSLTGAFRGQVCFVGERAESTKDWLSVTHNSPIKVAHISLRKAHFGEFVEQV